MDKLSFSRRARRRARRQRVKRIAFLLSVLGTITGLPGATFALDALERLGSPPPTRAELRGIEASESIASTTKFRREVFERRPRRQPGSSSEARAEGAEGAATTSGGSISEIISSAAAEFGLDGGYLLSGRLLRPLPVRRNHVGGIRVRVHLRPRRSSAYRRQASGRGSDQPLAQLRIGAVTRTRPRSPLGSMRSTTALGNTARHPMTQFASCSKVRNPVLVKGPATTTGALRVRGSKR
jgi:hypothetical protein